MSAAWNLEPPVTGIPDPDCPHCHTPGYPHRHWRQVDTGDPKPDSWIWRALFRLYGNGNAAV